MDSPVSIPIRFADPVPPVRGVGWVLRWAATFAVVTLVALMVAEFGYRLAAERSLYRAANAGLREAALPRANRPSIELAIRSRLDPNLSRGTRVVVQPAGLPRSSRPVVTLVAPADAVLPDWLQLVTVWNSHAELAVSAGG